MLAPSPISNRSALSMAAALLGSAVLSLGVFSLVGWSTGFLLLASIRPQYIPMAPETAILFIICGGYLLFNEHILRKVAGVSVCVFILLSFYSLLKFLSYFLQFDFNFENQLFANLKKYHEFPIHMSPITGALFFLSTATIVTSTLGKQQLRSLNIVASLGLILSQVGFISTLGYLYGVPFLYGSTVIPIAMTTTIAFFLLGAGLVALSTEKSIILRPFSGDAPLARLLRHLLPIVVASIIFTEVLIYKLRFSFQINPAVVSAVLTIAAVFIINIVMIQISSGLSRDLEKKEAERKSLENEIIDALEFNGKVLTASTIGVATYNSTGQCVLANEAIAQMIGTNVEGVKAQNFRHIGSWKHTGLLKEAEIALSTQSRREYECEIVSTFGKNVCLNFQFVPFQSKGEMHLLVLTIDTTDRKRSESFLVASELRYRRLFESAEDGILLINAVTGRIEDVNPFLVNLLGYSHTEYLGKCLWDIHFLGDSTKSREAFKKLQEIGYARYESLPLQTADGRTIQAEFVSNVYLVDNFKVIQCNIRDITQRKKLEGSLEHLAHYDVLTGLPNRVLFFARANAGLAKSRRDNKFCAVLFVDLDNSKSINDTMGHSMGDELLKDTAVRLKECVREMDTVARLGGDEFIVFMGDLDSAQSVQPIAQRIREKFDTPRLIAGNDIFVTATIGIAVYPNDGNDLEELLKNADTAMYTAKDDGKNAYCFFDSAMNRLAVKKMWIERGLRQALGSDGFRLFYQPIISTENGKIRGFEALLRWFPAGGALNITPDEFIPIAETTGLIVPIGEWVLYEACRFNKKLIDSGKGRPIVSVNVSVDQLRRKDFIDVIRAALDETGLPSDCLEIEITESLMIQSLENAIMILQSIRALGVKISLDDFGKGYSSLVHLQQLPIVNLKIDRLFIREINKETEGRIMIPALVDLAHKLKLHVVAEGVENEMQLDRLKSDGCDFFQGFVFSKAVPEDQAIAMYLKGTAHENFMGTI